MLRQGWLGHPSREEQIVYDPETEKEEERIEAKSRHVAKSGKVTYQDVGSLSLLLETSGAMELRRTKSRQILVALSHSQALAISQRTWPHSNSNSILLNVVILTPHQLSYD